MGELTDNMENKLMYNLSTTQKTQIMYNTNPTA